MGFDVLLLVFLDSLVGVSDCLCCMSVENL